jgi:hypothetical protein
MPATDLGHMDDEMAWDMPLPGCEGRTPCLGKGSLWFSRGP